MIRAKVAIVLMIVPLVLAIAIRYWPSPPARGFPEISHIVMLRPELRGAQTELATALGAAIQEHCNGKENLRIVEIGPDVTVKPKADPAAIAQTYGADALLLSAITLDAGLIELDLQLVHAKTRKILWRDTYQTPRRH